MLIFRIKARYRDNESRTVVEENPNAIIARNISPDIGFDRLINPYRDCEHRRCSIE